MKIIFEDDNIIVIEKPANLTVHPTNSKQDNTLVNQLLAYYPKIKDIGDNPLRPGLVHRLDKDTSGLMVIAKNKKSFENLKKQFAERKVTKKYLALVHGRVKDDKGIITKSISFSKKNYKKRTALLDENSKPAVTEYKVIKRFKKYTLLKVYPKTGRTHQIRIHLHSIGYPIVGDQQYKFKRVKTPEGLERQFLHAAALKFKSVDGKIMEFKSELPQDLYEQIRRIQ
ncbi:RluA family pseudouridine synthase [Patescibacteria group bacterium]|nr:RluA family pseudouridine synthase [Patescibacteria group bacterium]